MNSIAEGTAGSSGREVGMRAISAIGYCGSGLDALLKLLFPNASNSVAGSIATYHLFDRIDVGCKSGLDDIFVMTLTHFRDGEISMVEAGNVTLTGNMLIIVTSTSVAVCEYVVEQLRNAGIQRIHYSSCPTDAFYPLSLEKVWDPAIYKPIVMQES